MEQQPSSSAAAIAASDQCPKRRDGRHLSDCFPQQYEEQLSAKVQKLRGLLEWPAEEPIDIHRSPVENFRMRANFQMWHDDNRNKTPDGFYYCMFDAEKRPCEVTSFPRGTKRINNLMPEVMRACREDQCIFSNLFEIRFCTTQTLLLDSTAAENADAIVVFCYKKPLSAQWQEAARQLAERLAVKIIGRARKQKIVVSPSCSIRNESGSCADGSAATAMKKEEADLLAESIIETYSVKGKLYRYYQTEGAFTQPNAAVCQQMLTWASDRTADGVSSETDMLELYCGGGTFTIALAENFKRVLATEISKASVNLAHLNFRLNNVEDKIKVVRLSSEEFSEAYSNRDNSDSYRRRLKDAGVDFNDYDIRTVLVDPPRAGLDADTCKLLSQFDRIVYISCNPETLARDVAILQETHDVHRVAAFDQFPYTNHLESGVFLVKRVTCGGSRKRSAEDSRIEDETQTEKKACTGLAT